MFTCLCCGQSISPSSELKVCESCGNRYYLDEDCYIHHSWEKVLDLFIRDGGSEELLIKSAIEAREEWELRDYKSNEEEFVKIHLVTIMAPYAKNLEYYGRTCGKFAESFVNAHQDVIFSAKI